jgi:hypothetical protein
MDTLIYVVTLDHHKENLHEDIYFIQVRNKVVETARFYIRMPPEPIVLVIFNIKSMC